MSCLKADLVIITIIAKDGDPGKGVWRKASAITGTASDGTNFKWKKVKIFEY